MSSRSAARRIEEPRAVPLEADAIDAEALATAGRVRGWLSELITLWPSSQRGEVVLWVRTADGETSAGARMRAQVMAGVDSIARRVRKIRNDVPVVVEIGGGRTVVAPWRAVQRGYPGSA
jgi:hypothetical protein